MRALAYLSLVAIPVIVSAQQKSIPIRAVSAPIGASPTYTGFLSAVQELGAGKVLVDVAAERKMILLSAALDNERTISEPKSEWATYLSFAKFIRYLGDSVLMIDIDSRTLVLIDPDGNIGRVMALPKAQDFNQLTGGGAPVAVDAKGRLIYSGPRPFAFMTLCRMIEGRAMRDSTRVTSDSASIVRADFDTRTVDTIARTKVFVGARQTPMTTTDANCRVLSAKVRIDPSVPETDAWTVTSDGVVAVVRGHDYHIDWFDGERMRSTPKLPFDMRRLSEAEKRVKLDSAKRIVDSLTALGGYRMEVCGNSTRFTAQPAPAGQGDASRGGSSGSASTAGSGGRGSGGSGGGEGGAPPPPAACQRLTVAAEYPALDEMADYIAPIRANAALADRDGNVWILPTTSLAAVGGGLVYDVVNQKGELVERVQLPKDRAIAGFGRGGVVFLTQRADGKTTLEKRTVIRK